MNTRPNPTPASSLHTLRACLAFATLSSASAVSADTIAYYRFDDASDAGLTAPIPDASGHGYTLEPIQLPTLSPDVPVATIPASGAANIRSVRIVGHLAQDLYSPSDERLSRVEFKSFTIETWVRFVSLGGVQTIVGRDDVNEGTGRQSLFYLSKSDDGRVPDGYTSNGLRVELVTRDNRLLAINSSHVVQPDVWYHVAAVGDAVTGSLSLYADGTLIGQATGFTGLFVPSRHGMWSLGRGQYNNRVADRFDGYLDEVRFSDEALAPDRFLNATPLPPPPSVMEPVAPEPPAPVLHSAPDAPTALVTEPEPDTSAPAKRKSVRSSWLNRR